MGWTRWTLCKRLGRLGLCLSASDMAAGLAKYAGRT
jgi:hypothetical protein